MGCRSKFKYINKLVINYLAGFISLFIFYNFYMKVGVGIRVGIVQVLFLNLLYPVCNFMRVEVGFRVGVWVGLQRFNSEK